MNGSAGSLMVPCVVDNMVLAMFVDAGEGALLSALAGGRLFVPPSIIDPEETPPFGRQPSAEFAKGAFSLQRRLGWPVDAVRLHRRVAFYLDVGTTWQPIDLSLAELQQAAALMDPDSWQRATAIDPSCRVKRIGRGEAECAAVAITRGWRLWSDDAAIICLVATLFPWCRVERISDLLTRAVAASLIACEAATSLYNDVFKGRLGLWTERTLDCWEDRIVIR